MRKINALLTKEIVIAIVSFIALLSYVFLTYLWKSEAAHIPLFCAYLLGGAPLVWDLTKNAFRGEFGSDLLAGISIVTSIILGEYVAGVLVILMLSGGTALEQYAGRRAASVLQALAKRMPRIAHRKTDTGFTEVGVDEVVVGEKLIVLPFEVCPVDGTVVEGSGSMEESYLTGEPFKIKKLPGSGVLSGAINGDSPLTIIVDRLSADSRYAQIVKVMEAAEKDRPQLRRIGDRLGAWYTIVALTMALFAWLISSDPVRFLSVLVIATPCPLLIAIPVAIIGAISQAARNGIIVKNPAMLENIDICRTFIFDKTGTLTYGKPVVTDLFPGTGQELGTIIQVTASMEQFSKHPLSGAILEYAQSRSIALLPVTEISERSGEGLRGLVGEFKVEILGRKQILVKYPEAAKQLPPPATGLECIVIINGALGGVFRFHDEPRHESRAFIDHLGPKHRATKVILLSGDRKDEATYLASKVGISEVLFEKSPEDKVAIVREEARKNPTLFVGDGINDAPAMQAATVGIAFGHSNEITGEAADAVVMDASLGKVDEIIHIGRRMRTIALQSAIGGMAASVIGMVIACFGYLPPVVGALGQEVIDVIAVLNALRVVQGQRKLGEIS